MKKRFRESATETGGYDDLDSGSSRPAADEEEPAVDAEQPPSTIMSRLMAKSQKVEEDEGEAGRVLRLFFLDASCARQ